MPSDSRLAGTQPIYPQPIKADDNTLCGDFKPEVIIRRLKALENPVIPCISYNCSSPRKVLEPSADPFPIRIHVELYAIHRAITLFTYPSVEIARTVMRQRSATPLTIGLITSQGAQVEL